MGVFAIGTNFPLPLYLIAIFPFCFLDLPPTFLDHEDMRAILDVVIGDPQHPLELLQALIHPMLMEVHDELRIAGRK